MNTAESTRAGRYKAIVVSLAVAVALLLAAGLVVGNSGRTVDLDTRSGRLRTRIYAAGIRWVDRIDDGPLTPLLNAPPSSVPDWQPIQGAYPSRSTNYKWSPFHSQMVAVVGLMEFDGVRVDQRNRVVAAVLEACRTITRPTFYWEQGVCSLRDDSGAQVFSISVSEKPAAPHILPANARP